MGRQCVPLSPTPRLEHGSDLIELYIPEGTPAGTFVHPLQLDYQDFGQDNLLGHRATKWHFSVEASGLDGEARSLPLSVDAQGRLLLATAFTRPTSAVVVVTDDSFQCIRRLPGGTTVEIVRGGCEARVMVALQTASFLNCPTSMDVYSADGQPVDVDWTEPALPFYLANFTVSRSLGSTNSSVSPYRYSVGRHRVSYTVQLPVLGALSCTFSVVVLEGLGLFVHKVLDWQDAGITHQYLVAEPAMATDGVAVLRSLHFSSDGAFRVGLRHFNQRLFSIRAQVC